MDSKMSEANEIEADFDDFDDDDVELGDDNSDDILVDIDPVLDDADDLLGDDDDDSADDELLEESNRLDSIALADDPVRMYLKEIGQVPLLDSNREMWLSTQIAAERLMQHLTDELSRVEHVGGQEGLPTAVDVAQFAYVHIADNWAKLLEDVARFKIDPPDFRAIIDEAQQVMSNWDEDNRSYVRNYLRQREWGRDEPWNEMAEHLFEVMHGLYLLRFDEQMKIRGYSREHDELPPDPLVRQWMNTDPNTLDDLIYLYERTEERSEMAIEALTRAN